MTEILPYVPQIPHREENRLDRLCVLCFSPGCAYWLWCVCMVYSKDFESVYSSSSEEFQSVCVHHVLRL